MQTPREMAEEAVRCHSEGDMNGFSEYLHELHLLGISPVRIERMFRQEGLSLEVLSAAQRLSILPTNAA